MPPNVQSILVPTLDASSLDQLATVADKIVEFSNQLAFKSVQDPVTATASTNSLVFLVVELTKKIDALTQKFDSL